MNCLTSDQLRTLLVSDESAPPEWLDHLEGCSACQADLEEAGGMSGWELHGEQLAAPDETLSLLKRIPMETVMDSSLLWSDVFESGSDSSESLGGLGPYQVLRVLQRGGMGTVFLARDPRLDRDVAIKMIHPMFASSVEARAMFELEARAVAALDHPNILSIFDVGETAGRPWLVMPFVPGGTLQDRLDAGETFSNEDTRRLGAQVADALAHAHANGILHRDIKPSNILFDAENERVLLADFGLAQSIDDADSTSLAGTPEFMSPEQARSETLSPVSDVYSLGAVLHTMRFGKSPWQASGGAGSPLDYVRNDPAIGLSSEDGSLSPLLVRLMKPEASERPAASELADELRVEERSFRNWWFAVPFLIGLALLSILWPKQGDPPFLQQNDQVFASWAEAFDVAETGVPIDVTRDVELTEPFPDIRKPLHLRGVGDPRPLLEVSGSNGWMRLLSGELVLENLEIRLGEADVPAFVELSNSVLSVQNCRIISLLERNPGHGLTLIRSSGDSRVRLDDSEFLAKAMQLLHHDKAGHDLYLAANNLDVMMNRVLVVDAQHGDVQVAVSNSAFITRNLVQYSPRISPISLLSTNNYLFKVGPMISAPRNRSQRERIVWAGRSNTFSGPGNFVGPSLPGRSLSRLAQWEVLADEQGSRELPPPKRNHFEDPPTPLTFDCRKLLNERVPEVRFPPWTRTLRDQ